jgi:hypothetical protein
MTSRPDLIQPPRLAARLVALFTASEEATEAILGDLEEEFSSLAAKCGVAAARRWYWRQTMKSIAILAGAGLRSAPWSTGAVVAGGFFLNGLVRFIQPGMTSLLDKYQVYESNPQAYIFCLSYGIMLGHVILAALIGVLVAALAKGREMAATMALGLIFSTLTASGFLLMAANHVHFWYGMLPWSFASPLAVVIGGAIVRISRSAMVARSRDC